MQNTKVVTTLLYKEVEVRDFFDVDTQTCGVEVYQIYNDGSVERFGSIIDITIPDIEDIEENVKFDAAVETWLIDNGY